MDLVGRTIAVTGATGFLGGWIALDLLARGAIVRGVVRNPDKGTWLAQKGVRFARADLADRDALTEAFRGADAIVANAALYTLEVRGPQAFHDANVRGTENVFEAAAAAGVRRVVHVSSCAVYRPIPCVTIGEDAPKLGRLDRFWSWPYAMSKARSEEVAWALAGRRDLALTVVRPAGIFGPRDTQAVPIYRRLMRWPLLIAPTFVFPMAYGEDVARAIGNALERDGSIGRAYNLIGERASIWRFLRLWRRVNGRGPLVLPLPVPLGLWFDDSAAVRDLDWRNLPLEEAIRRTIEAPA